MLPGSRTFAHELGVARITVAAAYDQLVAEGYLDTNARRGTRVATDLPEHGFFAGGTDRIAVAGSMPAPNPWAPLRPVTMDGSSPSESSETSNPRWGTSGPAIS